MVKYEEKASSTAISSIYKPLATDKLQSALDRANKDKCIANISAYSLSLSLDPLIDNNSKEIFLILFKNVIPPPVVKIEKVKVKMQEEVLIEKKIKKQIIEIESKVGKSYDDKNKDIGGGSGGGKITTGKDKSNVGNVGVSTEKKDDAQVKLSKNKDKDKISDKNNGITDNDTNSKNKKNKNVEIEKEGIYNDILICKGSVNTIDKKRRKTNESIDTETLPLPLPLSFTPLNVSKNEKNNDKKSNEKTSNKKSNDKNGGDETVGPVSNLNITSDRDIEMKAGLIEWKGGVDNKEDKEEKKGKKSKLKIEFDRITSGEEVRTTVKVCI